MDGVDEAWDDRPGIGLSAAEKPDIRVPSTCIPTSSGDGLTFSHV